MYSLTVSASFDDRRCDIAFDEAIELLYISCPIMVHIKTLLE